MTASTNGQTGTQIYRRGLVSAQFETIHVYIVCRRQFEIICIRTSLSENERRGILNIVCIHTSAAFAWSALVLKPFAVNVRH